MAAQSFDANSASVNKPIKTVRIEVHPASAVRKGVLLRDRRHEWTVLAVVGALVLALIAGVTGYSVAAHGAGQARGAQTQDSGAGQAGSASGDSSDGGAVDITKSEASTLKLGYFANVTHALPVAGVEDGSYQKALGNVALKTQIFNDGPSAVEALNAGAVDASYLGPNPAINSYVKSHGKSVRIVAGAASGGAQLVVQPDITSAQDLRSKTLSTPNLGGTQDVALRVWLLKNGLKVNTTGGNDVTINPTSNGQTLKLFQQGRIQGAWLPQPWAARLVQEAGAKVLVDEKNLWENGSFPTTVLAVNTQFLEKNPGIVAKLLTAELDTKEFLQNGGQKGLDAINAGLKVTSGATLSNKILQASVDNLTFTLDPDASAYPTLLKNGQDAGVSQSADISQLFDLRILNQLLTKRGINPVSAAGLGLQ